MPRKEFQFVDDKYPLYRRYLPMPNRIKDFTSDTTHIDLTNAHAAAYPAEPFDLTLFTSRFDARAAAAISNLAGVFRKLRMSPFDYPAGEHLEDVLMEYIPYRNKEGEVLADPVHVPKEKCLALMAYPDYFPEWGNPASLRDMVSAVIAGANPGWCGTFGPGVDGLFDLIGDEDPTEGNYDMSQMHLLQIAYAYYDELTPPARDVLINHLLATGTIHRPNGYDKKTSGGLPNDWSRAGHVHVGPIKIRIGETENHILTIHTARYLTNQLLYQRDPTRDHDNRRNGDDSGLTCMNLMLYLLRCMLRNDFCEYNAKPYQTETRSALLNLCSYAYDHEVRLAARMVLDYISAHVAVSSNDLRRMVPFRRLNKDEHVTRLSNSDFEHDFMGIALLEPGLGADPMAEPFAIQAGNLRAYETPSPPVRLIPWSIVGDGGAAVMEALSEYRLPPSIHDLFVNDKHRRYFQRLHRTPQLDEVEGAGALDEDGRGISGRNADNMELYAGSPSYLISAGGAPAPYAIDPGPSTRFEKGRKKSAQQLGVAVPTSFMPTGRAANPGTQNNAKDLIQFGAFSDGFADPSVANYGVAPDFACGHKVHLPLWVSTAVQRDGQFLFVNKGTAPSLPNVITEPAGFFLAIFDDGEFSFLEAFDTWLHPGVSFQDFKRGVKQNNPHVVIQNNVEFTYKTLNGNVLHVIIWKDGTRADDAHHGARVQRIEYATGNPLIRDPTDRLGDAGNITNPFLNGTILNSTTEAVIEITNPFLNTKIILDMNDQRYPRRTSENGEVEQAGYHNEVWVNFSWQGENEGDFFHPFNTIAGAVAAVADGGVVKIMPGVTKERPFLPNNKRVKIEAPIGGVTLGAH